MRKFGPRYTLERRQSDAKYGYKEQARDLTHRRRPIITVDTRNQIVVNTVDTFFTSVGTTIRSTIGNLLQIANRTYISTIRVISLTTFGIYKIIGLIRIYLRLLVQYN